MSACEECWTRASDRSLRGEGFTAELYKEELTLHSIRAGLITDPVEALDDLDNDTSEDDDA